MAKRSKSGKRAIDRINEDVVRETLEYLNFNEQQVGAPARLWTSNKAKEVRVGPNAGQDVYVNLRDALFAFESFRTAHPNGLFSIRLPKGSHIVDYKFINLQRYEGLQDIFERNYNLLRILTPEIEAIFENGSYSVVINPNLTSIKERAFYGCTGLTSVTFPKAPRNSSQTKLTSIEEGAFQGCYALRALDLSATNLTSIGRGAFSTCTGLTLVTFPEGLTSIGYRAFWKCSGLTSVLFPDSLTSIGRETFEHCTGLTSVTFPEGLTIIKMRAFARCSVLAFVDFSRVTNMTKIGVEAFYECISLTDVTFPKGLSSIGKSAFSQCRRLEEVDFSHTDLTRIGDYAFTGCMSLESVVLPLILKSEISDVLIELKRHAERIDIKTHRTKFFKALRDDFLQADTVQEVQDWINYYKLRKFKFNRAVLNLIEYHAEVRRAEITRFRGGVIYNPYNNNIKRDFENKAQAGVDEYIQSEVYLTYLQYEQQRWQEQQRAQREKQRREQEEELRRQEKIEDASFRWKVGESGSLEQALKRFKIISPDSFTERNKRFRIVLPVGKHTTGFTLKSDDDEVTTIGDGDYRGLELPGKWDRLYIRTPDVDVQYDGMHYSVRVKSDVKDEAFYKCKRLKSVVFTKNVKSFGQYAFQDTSIVSLDLSKTKIETIPDGAFKNCKQLKSITFPIREPMSPYDGLKHIGGEAFASCESLERLQLSNELETIEEYAFSQCTTLKSIQFNKKLKTIGDEAFSGCPITTLDLTELYLLEAIGENAFQNVIEVKLKKFNKLGQLIQYNGNFAGIEGALYGPAGTPVQSSEEDSDYDLSFETDLLLGNAKLSDDDLSEFDFLYDIDEELDPYSKRGDPDRRDPGGGASGAAGAAGSIKLRF